MVSTYVSGQAHGTGGGVAVQKKAGGMVSPKTDPHPSPWPELDYKFEHAARISQMAKAAELSRHAIQERQAKEAIISWASQRWALSHDDLCQMRACSTANELLQQMLRVGEFRRPRR